MNRHELQPANLTIPGGSAWRRLPLFGAVAGLLGLGASAGLGISSPSQFFFSYLVAYLFFLSLALGGLFFVLVQLVTRAGWSVVVRRLAENSMATLPLFIPLFIPVALGLHTLYHWTHADAVAADPLLQGKQAFLNEPFFLVRAGVYLVCWSAIGWWFFRRSVTQDSTGGHQLTRRLQVASGPALVVFGVTVSFAAFDWVMSLDPHWYSTIFGVYFFAGSVVALFAMLILVVTALGRAGLLVSAVTVEHLHDLGKLLLAFVAFWAYIAFSQYFLIWYANIPEETIWFLHRWQGSWRWASLLLGVGHFVLPFFFLLPRTVKRSRPALALAASWVLAMHYLDLYWLVMPTLHHHTASPSLLDLTTLVGVGGAFIALFGWLMARHALIPINDPRLDESLAFENV